MRLPEVERGDSLRNRALIRVISAITGIRLPDAARVAFYHQDFVSSVFGEWTQEVMRGSGEWTVGERELMAAMVARWNSCDFCVGAHRAIAIRGLDPVVVDACLSDYRTAEISGRLRAALAFLETMTLHPESLGAADALTALREGLTRGQLVEAAAVAAIFNVITRYADALDFAIPTPDEFDRAATMMLKRGYS